MPETMTIPDIPEETRDELAARAAQVGQSLELYARAQLVELARRPSRANLWDRIEQRVTAAGTRLPAEEIVRLRDGGRR